MCRVVTAQYLGLGVQMDGELKMLTLGLLWSMLSLSMLQVVVVQSVSCSS